jgi:hypothetical protein
VPAARTGGVGVSVGVKLPAAKRKEIQDALEFAMQARRLGPEGKFKVSASGIIMMPRIYVGLAHDSEAEHTAYLARRFNKDFIVTYLPVFIPEGMGHDCEAALTGAAMRPVYADFTMYESSKISYCVIRHVSVLLTL